jgi:hypothetical protein
VRPIVAQGLVTRVVVLVLDSLELRLELPHTADRPLKRRLLRLASALISPRTRDSNPRHCSGRRAGRKHTRRQMRSCAPRWRRRTRLEVDRGRARGRVGRARGWIVRVPSRHHCERGVDG